MRILVTGREGQVARSLAERAAGRADVEIILAGRPELDLADPRSAEIVIAAARPDVVVSAAAYTAVDRAEDEPDKAWAVNVDGAGAVAAAAARLGAPVVHLSTDYVFSGDGNLPYIETDSPAPKNVYGRTKLAGEIAVAAVNPRHVILRTAWVYSPFGGNFVKTMLRLARDRGAVSVVSDQWGNPTSALDIADGILHIAAAMRTMPDPVRYGVFQLVGNGDSNWSGLASHVFRTSRALGGPFAEVNEIDTAAYPTKASRPSNSRLSTAKLARHYGWSAPHWRESSAAVVARLLNAVPA